MGETEPGAGALLTEVWPTCIFQQQVLFSEEAPILRLQFGKNTLDRSLVEFERKKKSLPPSLLRSSTLSHEIFLYQFVKPTLIGIEFVRSFDQLLFLKKEKKQLSVRGKDLTPPVPFLICKSPHN